MIFFLGVKGDLGGGAVVIFNSLKSIYTLYLYTLHIKMLGNHSLIFGNLIRKRLSGTK